MVRAVLNLSRCRKPFTRMTILFSLKQSHLSIVLDESGEVSRLGMWTFQKQQCVWRERCSSHRVMQKCQSQITIASSWLPL